MTHPTIFSNPSIMTNAIKHWQTANCEPPIGELASTRYLTPAEILAFLLAARADAESHCAMLLMCALLSGISIMDLCNAIWEDLNLDSSVLVTMSALTDNYVAHRLNPPTIGLLRRWSIESDNSYDLIFSWHNDQFTFDDLKEALNRIARVAGIPSLTLDDLQRSHEVIALGVALCDVPLASTPASTNDAGTAAEIEEPAAA